MQPPLRFILQRAAQPGRVEIPPHPFGAPKSRGPRLARRGCPGEPCPCPGRGRRVPWSGAPLTRRSSPRSPGAPPPGKRQASGGVSRAFSLAEPVPSRPRTPTSPLPGRRADSRRSLRRPLPPLPPPDRPEFPSSAPPRAGRPSPPPRAPSSGHCPLSLRPGHTRPPAEERPAPLGFVPNSASALPSAPPRASPLPSPVPAPALAGSPLPRPRSFHTNSHSSHSALPPFKLQGK